MHLLEAGHELVLIGEPAAVAPALMTAFTDALDDIPEPAAGWLVTADPTRCGPARSRIRTLLVGGLEPSRPAQRCDCVARDLMAAALEILASEAMSGTKAGLH
jgi:hypothetical protein